MIMIKMVQLKLIVMKPKMKKFMMQTQKIIINYKILCIQKVRNQIVNFMDLLTNNLIEN